ncbi:MAG: ABC transporter permease [Lachnospiraceae bacterium]|nr:ABC transporter permease [Lachnospiraceae bacterium]
MKIVTNAAQVKDKKKKKLSNIIMCAPLTVWVIALIILPIAYLLFMSFMTKGPMGTVRYIFSVESYTQILEPEYFKVVKKSVLIAGISTVACVGLGYPLAYFIASKKKMSGTLMLMLMLPFWTCALVTIYSFVIMFSNSGLINSFLMKIGLIDHPIQMLYNNFSVSVGMVYMLLPFAAMPMYSSIEKMDKNLIEASKDLGAGPVRTFLKVTLPLTKPGIFAAIILTFIPCIGYYMITDMLGGGTTMLIGNVIYNQFTSARDWPFGAALSCVLAAIILLSVFIYTKLGGDLDDLGA